MISFIYFTWWRLGILLNLRLYFIVLISSLFSIFYTRCHFHSEGYTVHFRGKFTSYFSTDFNEYTPECGSHLARIFTTQNAPNTPRPGALNFENGICMSGVRAGLGSTELILCKKWAFETDFGGIVNWNLGQKIAFRAKIFQNLLINWSQNVVFFLIKGSKELNHAANGGLKTAGELRKGVLTAGHTYPAHICECPHPRASTMFNFVFQQTVWAYMVCLFIPPYASFTFKQNYRGKHVKNNQISLTTKS